MIALRDAYTIARTKLRIRKIRTGLTVGISGILFGLMLTSSFVVAGVEKGVDDFSKEGLGSKYILAATRFDQAEYEKMSALSQDQAIIKRAEVLQKQLIEDKKKEAKRLAIDYDPSSEEKPFDEYDGIRYLNTGTQAAQMAIKEYQATQPKVESDFAVIKRSFAPYKPTTYYQSRPIAPASGSWATMKSGSEELKIQTARVQAAAPDPYSENADPIASGVILMDDVLAKPFLVRGQKWQPKNGTVPVIVTYNQAEKMLGLKKLANGASVAQKLDRIREVRENIAGHTIDTCYRNSTSKTQIQEALSQKKDIEKNKNNKDYQKPSMVYALPSSTTCAAVTVASDTRTAVEKKYQTNLEEFTKKFNNVEDPSQQKVTFEVVGLSAGIPTQSQMLLADILSSMFVSSLGNGWVVPKDMYEKLPAQYQQLDSIASQTTQDSYVYTQPTAYYAEFSNFDSARAAAKKYSCFASTCGASGVVAMPFGSGSIVLAEVKEQARTALTYATLVIAGIAAIIMLGTIGRAIADARRETAVFRAIGAKRRDISSIYVVYTILLSLRVILFAIVLAVFVVGVIDYYFAPDATVNAQLLFGASDLGKTFHLYGLNMGEVLMLFGVIIATGLVGMLIPLLRAIRRNPISDMRDE